MKQSRRVPGQRAGRLPPGDIAHYNSSEFGLGVELVKLPGREDGDRAWGHTSAGGSFVLAVDGPRPLAVAWLHNRADGWKSGISKNILSAVAEFAAGRELKGRQ